jgi:hypothetical protein
MEIKADARQHCPGSSEMALTVSLACSHPASVKIPWDILWAAPTRAAFPLAEHLPYCTIWFLSPLQDPSCLWCWNCLKPKEETVLIGWVWHGQRMENTCLAVMLLPNYEASHGTLLPLGS